MLLRVTVKLLRKELRQDIRINLIIRQMLVNK